MEEELINEASLIELGFTWNAKKTYLQKGKFIARLINNNYVFQFGELLDIPNKKYISQLKLLYFALTDEELIKE